MANAETIQSALRDLVGQRCERAENPYGSALSLDFGTLGLRQGDAPGTKTHGWRHLTVLSPWRLENDHEVIADWNVTGGAGGPLGATIQVLVGKAVVETHSVGPGWDLTLRLSDALTLRVFSDRTEDREDAWFVLGTDGLEAGAGFSPRFR